MKRLLAVALLCLAAAGGSARAETGDPCAFALVPMPLHPASGERAGLRLEGGIFGPGAGPAVARAQMRSNVIELDVVQTRELAAFPGYRPVGDILLDVLAYVGPLAAGAYPVVVTTRSFVDGVTNVPCPARIETLRIAAAPAPVETLDAVEFHDRTRDRHHLTADPAEIAAYDAAGFTRTGQGFKVYARGGSDGRFEVWRFVPAAGTALDGMFLTASGREFGDVERNPYWRFESTPFEIALPDTLTGQCPPGSHPVFRVVDPRNGDHRWIDDAALREALVQGGWFADGYGYRGVAMGAPGAAA
jgi:hypothetical protein